jgi:hypothetical protein
MTLAALVAGAVENGAIGENERGHRLVSRLSQC